jgi:hypothetical protein
MRRVLFLCLSVLTVLPAAGFAAPDVKTGLWEIRKNRAAGAEVRNDTLALTVGGRNPQPVAAYSQFDVVALKDGQSIEIRVDVATDSKRDGGRDIRIGLGFSTAAINSSATLLVPLSGYYLTLPSGTSGVSPRIVWVDREDDAVNFFNSATAMVGNPRFRGSVTVTGEFKPLVLKIRRSGDSLVFSGSLDGMEFGQALMAGGATLIPDFKFNTVGLAHAFADGATARFKNFGLEFSR